MNRMTFKTDVALLRIERIQQMLRRQDMTLYEIAEAIHISLRWARSYITHLHEAGMIHVSAYRLQSMEVKTVSHALYCWGAAKDHPKPAPLSGAQRAARKRELIMDDEELHEKILAKRRAAAWTPRCDWAAAWIQPRGGA